MKKQFFSTLRQIPSSIWILGFVSVFMDISLSMSHTVIPFILLETLGASGFMVGMIEGIAKFSAIILKVFSGVWSDYLRKRKVFVLFGYTLGIFSKLLLALIPSSGGVLAANVLDKFSKGIRETPRDALIADITPQFIRGAGFGLHQSLVTMGMLLGPIITIILLNKAYDLETISWIAIIPGLMALALLLFGVREPKTHNVEKRTNPICRGNLKRLSSAYWWVVAIGSIFTLARFSEVFLLLHAQQEGISKIFVPLIVIVMYVAYAATAYPFGKLSDKMSPFKLLTAGIIVLIAADLTLAVTHHWGLMILGIMLWGLHLGITQGVLARMIADAAPADLRGTAYGLYNLMVGLALLIANGLAGFLWDRFSPSITFFTSAIFGGAALIVLVLRDKKRN